MSAAQQPSMWTPPGADAQPAVGAWTPPAADKTAGAPDLGKTLQNEGFLDSAWDAIKGLPNIFGSMSLSAARQRDADLDKAFNATTPEDRRAAVRDLLIRNLPLGIGSTGYKVMNGNLPGALGDLTPLIIGAAIGGGMKASPALSDAAGSAADAVSGAASSPFGKAVIGRNPGLKFGLSILDWFRNRSIPPEYDDIAQGMGQTKYANLTPKQQQAVQSIYARLKNPGAVDQGTPPGPKPPGWSDQFATPAPTNGQPLRPPLAEPNPAPPNIPGLQIQPNFTGPIRPPYGAPNPTESAETAIPFGQPGTRGFRMPANPPKVSTSQPITVHSAPEISQQFQQPVSQMSPADVMQMSPAEIAARLKAEMEGNGWNGSSESSPAPENPKVVSIKQGKASAKGQRIAEALHAEGITSDMAEAIPDGTTGAQKIASGEVPGWGDIIDHLVNQGKLPKGETAPNMSKPEVLFYLRKLEQPAASGQ